MTPTIEEIKRAREYGATWWNKSFQWAMILRIFAWLVSKAPSNRSKDVYPLSKDAWVDWIGKSMPSSFVSSL